MRCERCKASCEVHYAESYEVDWYCEAGFPEEERNEDKNGDLGCNLHYKTIQKRVDESEKAWIKDKEQYVDWFLKTGGLENEREN